MGRMGFQFHPLCLGSTWLADREGGGGVCSGVWSLVKTPVNVYADYEHSLVAYVGCGLIVPD